MGRLFSSTSIDSRSLGGRAFALCQTCAPTIARASWVGWKVTLGHKKISFVQWHFFAAIADSAIKDRLRANTDELIERGGFGSPSLFVDGEDMYFGNDRLPLVRAALS